MTKPLPIRSRLSLGEAIEIKQELWDGVITQSQLALSYLITQATVSRILNGIQWQEAPWPNGEEGAIPELRRKHIYTERSVILGVKSLPEPRADQLVAVAARVAELDAQEARNRDDEFSRSIRMKPTGVE